MNRLAEETSPYLLQHAEDPVDWYPWGEAALAAARDSGKPILLSIGYAACHWCHVMHRESFQDPAVAAEMNQRFVCIKVDREERPDLDRIYQLAQQLLTQRSGGWPLTIFLTPEQLPFFGGTYFPPTPRLGLPGFRELLQRVREAYDRSDELDEQHRALRGFLAEQEAGPPPAEALDASPLDDARRRLEALFDARYGGFGGAPKFPHPPTIAFLLRRWRASATGEQPDLQALYMASFSMHRMAESGLMDQLEGGAFRYAVDAAWEIPHFEKMLYDNAQLLPLYAELANATADRSYAETARSIAGWMLQRMRLAEVPLFAGSEDADSEGVEGRYYVFAQEDLREAAGDDYPYVSLRYGLDSDPNFEGSWHLHPRASLAEIVESTGRSETTITDALTRTHDALRSRRDPRPRPRRDDKVITAWNALAVAGLLRAGRALGERSWIDAAFAALDALLERCRPDGTLHAVWDGQRARFPAYLDDHAFLLDALLEALQTRWRDDDLALARLLADELLVRFADPAGGFYFTASDHEPLIHRPRPFADEATPAGNAVAAQALGRLGHLSGATRFLEAARRCVLRALPELRGHSAAYTAMLVALEEQLDPPELVVLRGPEAERWARGLAVTYAPHRMVVTIPAGARDLPAHLDAMQAGEGPGGSTLAWVCRGTVCEGPLASAEALGGLLGGAS